MAGLQFGNWNDMTWVEKREGVKQIIFATAAENFSCGIGEYVVGHALHPHSHPNEQMSVCLRGSCDYYVDGKPYVMTVGSWITIPANVPHFIYVHNSDGPCLVMDISSPARPDRSKEYNMALEKMKEESP